jgi:uncharacterized membrane protein YraQ (UPF0718 family)/copper chaperone CopZ
MSELVAVFMSWMANSYRVALELSPWLLLGAGAAGLLHGLVPPGFLERHLQGRAGVVKAVLLGIPLPLCSCGVIPAGVSLKKDGASDGAALGFLVATPQTGVDSILVSASLLVFHFALTKVVAALVTGVAAGWSADRFGGTSPGTPVASCGVGGGASHAHSRGFGAMVAHSVEVVRAIWGWLLFGILASGAIETLLPANAMAPYLGSGGALGWLMALAVGIPLYVCATASVPLAAALVHAGLPTGAAMVFLMAGPATNLATIGAVGRTFGRKNLMIYLASIVVGSVVFGLGYEEIFGNLAVGEAAHADHGDHAGWASMVATWVLGGALVWFAGEDLRSAWGRRKDRMAADGALVVGVAGMTCGGCASRLERLLRATEGVSEAAVSLESGAARVRGGVQRAAIEAVIRNAGFEPGLAPPGAFSETPPRG